jgi:hypothetical protein
VVQWHMIWTRRSKQCGSFECSFILRELISAHVSYIFTLNTCMRSAVVSMSVRSSCCRIQDTIYDENDSRDDRLVLNLFLLQSGSNFQYNKC